MNNGFKVIALSGFIACSNMMISGCASIAEGVARGLTEKDKTLQPRLCELHGPAFDGIAQSIEPGRTNSSTANNVIIHKVMMIHGIGGAKPGYSVRLQNNLIAALGLTRVSKVTKKIELRSPVYSKEPMGTLLVTRFQNNDRNKELHFYELSWSVITQPEKDFLAASDSSLYAAHRAEVNQELKVFVNNLVVDPALYTGMKKNMIIESASQAICWMLHKNWKILPNHSVATCSRENVEDMFNLLAANTSQDFSFISHSLGSRIVVDMLDKEVSRISRKHKGSSSKTIKKIHNLIKNFEFRLYMMSNQLPLLQLGRAPAEITGQYNQYCLPDGKHYQNRFLDKLFIVAFSDPNDLLSYNIPYDFANKYIDSRLCPEIVNVSIGVTEPIDLFGIGKFANPLSAHTEYDNDERVIGVMTHGIGQKETHPAVFASCKWLETIQD